MIEHILARCQEQEALFLLLSVMQCKSNARAMREQMPTNTFRGLAFENSNAAGEISGIPGVLHYHIG